MSLTLFSDLIPLKFNNMINKVQYRLATTSAKEVSTYMQTLTRYLSNIMNSVLLGLPAEIKELIYFDALSHTGAMLLVSKKNSHACFIVVVLSFCHLRCR